MTKPLTPEQQTVKDLRDARALIDTPEKWIKGRLARSKFGNACDPISQNAACFCSVGALVRATDKSLERVDRACLALRNNFDKPPPSVAIWNDASSTTHKDVMAAFDRAIADAEMFA